MTKRNLGRPEEIVKSDKFNGHVLYYPGAGTDYGPLELFSTSPALTTVIYADYGVTSVETSAFILSLYDWKSSPILYHEKIPHHQLSRFLASEVGDTKLIKVVEYYHLETRLSSVDGRELSFHSFGADGCFLYQHLVQTSLTPEIVVLQDHGTGGNWTTFGVGGKLEAIARSTVLPDYLFVAKNTEVWEGYSQVSDYVVYSGQMHNHGRALFQRDS